MQHKIFENGGFVLHKIPSTSNSRCHYSAWYAADGSLIDADCVDSRGRSRTVRTGGDVHRYLQNLGKRYACECSILP